jgi:O-antigen/teichoic acid export membrane protein
MFDWAQALWMAAALVLLIKNWMDLWDLHAYATLSLGVVAVGFVFLIIQYVTRRPGCGKTPSSSRCCRR